jgi:Xaa-Pro dipeptidase
MSTEFQRKLAKVRELLKREKAPAALVGRQSNFSWLACGGEAHVAINSERSVGQFVVTPRQVYMFANRIELGRLFDEEIGGFGIKPILFNWYDSNEAPDLLRDVADPRKIISDTGHFGTHAKPELFAPLRFSLEADEVHRLRAVGRSAEAAMHRACAAIKPGMTEFAIAGRLAKECYDLGLVPVVTLIAVDERIRRYRHPIPTNTKLKRLAMLVLCARQHGLIVSLTRLVHFGKLPKDLRERHNAVCEVDAAFMSVTQIGVAIKEVFQRGIASYAENGFPDEWHLHHQGGPCGYEPRDYLGSLTAAGDVLPNQAFAWNPSITGTKSEDTILATTNGNEIVTAAKDWPMVEVKIGGKKILRPDILTR